MEKCAFCKIPKEEIILETGYCYVVPDKYPAAKGHLLVITKKHYSSITEIPDSELCDVIKTIREMQKRMIEKLGVKGIDLIQHYKPFVEESRLKKEHVHFHLIPRNFNDRIYQKKGSMERERLSEKKRDELIEKLK